jgi:predicted metal-dependent HD superfamily phosphohydrolase
MPATNKGDLNVRSYWDRYIGEALPAENYAKLRNEYRRNYRHYHSWEHIQKSFGLFRQVEQTLRDPQLVAVALFWHDYVYIPGSPDNEWFSGLQAIDTFLPNHRFSWQGTSTDYLDLFQAVQCTKGHEETDSYDVNCLLDIDMAPVGAPEHVFRENEAKLWREYSATGVSEEQFRVGRKKWLEEHHGKKLYHTVWANALFADQAQRNIEASLRRLG